MRIAIKTCNHNKISMDKYIWAWCIYTTNKSWNHSHNITTQTYLHARHALTSWCT